MGDFLVLDNLFVLWNYSYMIWDGDFILGAVIHCIFNVLFVAFWPT